MAHHDDDVNSVLAYHPLTRASRNVQGVWYKRESQQSGQSVALISHSGYDTRAVMSKAAIITAGGPHPMREPACLHELLKGLPQLPLTATNRQISAQALSTHLWVLSCQHHEYVKVTVHEASSWAGGLCTGGAAKPQVTTCRDNHGEIKHNTKCLVRAGGSRWG